MVEFTCEAIWSWTFICWKIFIYLFIYGCFGSSFLCEGFSLVVASGGHSSSCCAGLSLSRPLLLQSTGSRRAGSVIVAHGPSCSAACGIFTDQGSNPCPMHWQADSQPLCHQGSPVGRFLITISISLLLISLFIFSISSWFSLGRLYLSKNLSISSRLSIILA